MAQIDRFNYRTASPGTLLVVVGKGFGKEQGEGNIKFADSLGRPRINGKPTSWTDTKIEVPVPNDARTGEVRVYAHDKVSNAQELHVSPEGVLVTWF